MQPLIPKEAILVTGGIALGLLGAALAICALVEWRKGHIGRPAIATNALLLWQVFYESWNSLPIWMHWYLNIGTVVGVLALVTYVLKKRLPTIFYRGAAWTYGSLTIIVVVLAMLEPWRPVF